MFKRSVNEYLFNGASVADGTRPVLNSSWGTSITPAQNSYGSFVNLGVLSSTYDIYEWSFGALLAGISALARVAMVDIQYDPAGGTSFTAPLVTDLFIGNAAGHGQVVGPERAGWRFRRRIPAGASVGVRGSVNSATLTAFRGWIYDAWGRPTRPDLARTHAYCDSFGATLASSSGVAITPGTTSEGAWTEIGTLSRRIDFWEYSFGLSDDVANGANVYIDIGIGDASNKRVIIKNACTGLGTAEQSYRMGPSHVEATGFSGDKVYARCQSSAALDDGTYSLAVYGCGG